MCVPTGAAGASGISPNALYSANLSSTGSFIDVQVGNVIYHAQYNTSTYLQLFIRPATVPVLIDLKRFSQYDITTVDSFIRDNYTLSSNIDIDTVLYNASREYNRTWLRQQDPVSGLWRLDEICLFSSNGGGRVNIWVNNIYTALFLG